MRDPKYYISLKTGKKRKKEKIKEKYFLNIIR
jgi:hypothetical protein